MVCLYFLMLYFLWFSVCAAFCLVAVNSGLFPVYPVYFEGSVLSLSLLTLVRLLLHVPNLFPLGSGVANLGSRGISEVSATRDIMKSWFPELSFLTHTFYEVERAKDVKACACEWNDCNTETDWVRMQPPVRVCTICTYPSLSTRCQKRVHVCVCTSSGSTGRRVVPSACGVIGSAHLGTGDNTQEDTCHRWALSSCLHHRHTHSHSTPLSVTRTHTHTSISITTLFLSQSLLLYLNTHTHRLSLRLHRARISPLFKHAQTTCWPQTCYTDNSNNSPSLLHSAGRYYFLQSALFCGLQKLLSLVWVTFWRD